MATHRYVRDKFALSIGLLIFCFAGHSVFPEVFASMKHAKDGPKVLNQTYGFVTVLYIFIAICGFLWLGFDAPEQVTQARRAPRRALPRWDVVVAWSH